MTYDNGLRSKDGLARIATTAKHTFAAFDEASYLALNDRARASYNNDRIRFITKQLLIQTPDLTNAQKQVRARLASNIDGDAGEFGVMLDGDASLGKTTILQALVESVYFQHTKRHPEHVKLGHIPIVFIDVPPTSRGKTLMAAFADFLGLPVADRDTMDTIRKRVAHVMREARTTLIIVDELHNLAGRRSINNDESVDVLRQLQREVPATFVYAGIDLANGNLLSSSRSRQIVARFSHIPLRRYNLYDARDVAVWKSIVTAYAKQLPLRHTAVADLVTMNEYLLARSGGSIGSLGRLLTDASVSLINDDTATETITRKQLQTIVLDRAAEEIFAKYRNGKNGARFDDVLDND